MKCGINLRKLGNQFPEDIFIDDKYIVILGKYYSIEPAKNLLHIWERKETEFNNIDGNIYPGTDNYDYYLKVYYLMKIMFTYMVKTF